MAARKPENTFRASVHKYLPPTLHHEKMCNPYSSGTADDWYSGTRGDLWVEYKFLPKIPVTASVWLVNPNVKKPMLSVNQRDWLNERYAEGRTVAVVVGCREGGVIMRDQEWMWEYTPQMFRDRLVPRQAIAQWITQTTTR
jgi:hypothetical protein